MAGIYIHVPFCASRCGYCDFYSTTQTELRDGYAEAARAELEARRGCLGDAPLRTIYFGGGTPSLLTAAQVGGLLDAIGGLWDVSGLEEVTLEANPDDLTPDYLAALRTAGIDRLSVGVQSFDEGDLIFTGRRHTAAQAVKAIENARGAGFENISIDLIYGIPGQDERTWERNLRTAAALRPEHISAYHLTIEPGTPFGRRSLRPVDERTSERHYALLHDTLTGAGYEHYEISNFALPGRRAVHNSAYWTGEPYLGIGPGAHSFDGAVRTACAPSLADYLKAPAFTAERLTPADRHNEFVMLSLRRAEGIDLAEYGRRFGSEALDRLLRTAGRFTPGGLVELTGGRCRIPARKWLVSDSVIMDFFADPVPRGRG